MDLTVSIAKQSAFALRLAGAAAGKLATGGTAGGGGNSVLSPLSLHVALSMVAAGARGPTLDELVAVLGPGCSADDLAALAAQVVELVLADGSSAGGPRVAFADGVWVDASVKLKPAFDEVATAKFKAVAQSVDFQAKAAEVTNQINSWVEKVTSGLIKDLLPLGSVGSNTRLVLGNALYFKGAWTEKFDASKTKESEFHLLDGSTVQVPFMASGKKQYVSAHDGFKVLKLPYEQGDDKRQFSMYIFLPEARDGLWSLAGKLSSGPEFLNNHLPVRKVPVGDFKIPKFKISFGLEASDLLQGLGLKLPFGANADLTGMVDSPVGRDLYVSSIFHKSFIEVNEEGTEAAAASAAVVGWRSLPPPPQDFVADHPFLFLIREDMTGVVMFIGHMLNPRLAE